MKKRETIKDRVNNTPTPYYPAGRNRKIAGIGEFPSMILARWDEKGEFKTFFKLGAVTADFAYYIDEEEDTIMLNRDMKFVLDSFLASNCLESLVQNNQELLWISNAVIRWQKEEYVKPNQLTPEIKRILKQVDIEKLSAKERLIYFAYLNNGPVKYTKPQSLMAVLSNDLNRYNEQLAAVMEMLTKNED